MRRPPQTGDRAPVVLITFPDFDTDDPDIGGAFTAAGFEMRLAPKHGPRSTTELLELCSDASGAIVSTDPFTADVLRNSPILQVVARSGVGLDTVDVAAATELGIAVVTTPGANETTVADHALALMLALLRRIPENDAGVRRGEWRRTGVHAPRLLTGCTVGLVGYGNIGRRVAQRLAGFDVELLIADPYAPASATARVVELPELLERSDIVSLHTPLLPSTRHLIDDEALHRMQAHAVLVNTSRGEVVDEGALFRALRDGVIAGAAL
ncbi:MAG TPA: NAD(P)-dependent oxidoreductase, partial [Ilumatobacteraceae bacterium]|nr:NAD(P)-dependent oxidoreductase [Ilumatobacteraceae bacterium]